MQLTDEQIAKFIYEAVMHFHGGTLLPWYCHPYYEYGLKLVKEFKEKE